MFIVLEEIRCSLPARSALKISIYRQVYLLTREFNETYRHLFPVLKSLWAAVIVLTFYGAIRFHGVVSFTLLIFGLNCAIVFAFMFGVFAEINKRWKILLHSWRKQVQSNMGIYRKTLDSLTEQRIFIGNLYFVDKLMVLTLCKVISDVAINVLLLN
ncbi:unnamed protein product [Allacma fusca]|uniref:Uncharacterized protein n=1 Tax=Allacma fusca TaxID=39272 RepID=A0A8J2LPM6_9HEXA|nr:unnamed protein product [Allacma fusca]